MKKMLVPKSTLLTIMAIVLIAALTAAAANTPKIIGAFFIKGKVGLNWQKADGATQYSVYRKSADSDYEKIGTSEKNHYFDTDLAPGAVYTYKVSANVAGEEKFSNEKSVTIPGGAADFHAPKGLEARVERNSIMIHWDTVKGAMAYNLYRSTTQGDNYDIVANAQAAKTSDKDGLERGATYYYVVTALNAEFEESGYSNEITVKYGLSAEESAALEAEQNKIDLVDMNLSLVFSITDFGKKGKLDFPSDVYTNSENNIYVVDSRNALVHCYDNNGNFLFTFVSDEESNGSKPGMFIRPVAIFIDNQDKVYISDVERGDIQVFSKDGKFIKQIKPVLEAGKKGFRPVSFHVLNDGRIIVSDYINNRVLFIGQDGKILKTIGNERGGAEGQFNKPDGITVIDEKIICVVDIFNFRVQLFDMNGDFIRAFGKAGKEPGSFGRPKEIAIDGKGWIWVSDAMSNLIQGYTEEGEVKAVVGLAKDKDAVFAIPRGIYFSGGRLYVVSRVANKVDVFKIGN